MKIERGYPIYTVTPKAENAIVKGHPWVYDAEILNIEGETANGGLVDVISRKGRYLGTGFLSQQSKIRVRLISRNANDRFDEAFWRRKLQWAWDYRKSVMDPADLDACRVIFGEADAFPGLTVDKFHDLLSVQVLSVGMENLQDLLLPALVDILRRDGQPIRGVFLRNDVALRDKEGLPQGKGLAAGPAHDPGQPFHHRRGNGRHQLFLAGIITVQVARRNACGPGDLAHACALAVAQQLLGSGLQDARPHLIFQNLRHKNEPPFTFVQ